METFRLVSLEQAGRCPRRPPPHLAPSRFYGPYEPKNDDLVSVIERGFYLIR